MTSSTLIIATYNWPEALCLCLKSVQEQKVLPDEIIIADDGSGEATAILIKDFQKDFPVEIKHIWHPDEGFRLAAIRNKGIAASNGDYIIQIDGDLILDPHFIEDHLAIRKPGYFVAGSRVMLCESSSIGLLRNCSINLKKYGSQKLVINGIRNSFLRNILAERYKIKGKHKYYVKGCNMAFAKRDLIKVNGYNEAFKGWGSEDREIAIRLINAGVKKQSLKMGAVCFHLFHGVRSRNVEIENEAKMKAAIEQNLVEAPEGLNKYLITQH